MTALTQPVRIIALGVVGFAATVPAFAAEEWTSNFNIGKADLASSGSNPYFILEPGYQLILEDGIDRLTITVLDETETVDGVETRVVEERETKRGKLAEVSRNFFAISKSTNSVFYFGEDTDNYKPDGTVKHEGGWRAGEKGAKPGMIMPGTVLIGARHYQEYAPGEAMDRARIVSTSETVEVSAGKFENVLKTEETTPLEPHEKEYKYYARGVGLLMDGGFKLVRYGKSK